MISSTIDALNARKKKVFDDLQDLERQIYDMETSYLNDNSQFGNALKGFDSSATTNKASSSAKRTRRFQVEDRLFSLSSSSSPATEELARESDARADAIQATPGSRLKGAGAASLGPSKGSQPKRNRGNFRDVKKMRQMSDHEEDGEDGDNGLQ